jgi:hypothetical protein
VKATKAAADIHARNKRIVTAEGEVEQQKWETISADPFLLTDNIPVTAKGEVEQQKWETISTDPLLPTDSTPGAATKARGGADELFCNCWWNRGDICWRIRQRDR